MKVFDCAKVSQDREKKRDSLLGRFGASRKEKNPQEILILALKPALDQRFSIVCAACLPDQPEPMPLILVGPTGIWLVHATAQKGLYQINEETWEELDERTRRYKPVKPNPMTLTIQKAQVLADFLGERGLSAPPIEPVVFFSHPGAHAAINHPVARIVPIDALNRFISRILSSPVTLDGEGIQKIIAVLVREDDTSLPIGEIRDAYSLRELPAPKKPREPTRLETISRDEPGVVGRLSKYLPFSRRQWFLLGIMSAVTAIVLLVLVIVVVITSGG